MLRTTVIINPASGRGAGARRLERLRTLFGAHGISDIRTTLAPGDEARVVREAVRDGAGTLVVAGGDGTWGKAAVALARLGSPARIAFLANGSGNDFGKNLAPRAGDHAAMAALVARSAGGGVEQRVDLGSVDGQWFLNVAGFGFDVATLISSQRKSVLRGNAIYISAALRHLLFYRGFRVQADVFGDVAPRMRMMLTISNGLNFGGAFRIAPAARVDDGVLDFVSIGDVHRLMRLPLFAGALRGVHLAHPKVDAVRAAGATLAFDAPPDFELDGELHHASAATVRVETVPGVLRVLVG